MGTTSPTKLLEFLGMAITLWLSLIECRELGLVNELILVLGDNTSAVHWIIRSSLPKTSVYRPTVLFIARKIATLLAESKNFIMPQHLPGILNSIADWLSFEGEERRQHGMGRQFKIQLRMTAHPTTSLLTESFLPSPSSFQPISKSHTCQKT